MCRRVNWSSWTAILENSAYEWHQHVRLGRAAGLSNEKMVALHHWRTSEQFSAAEKALLAYVDALNASDHPLDDVHNELAKHYGPDVLVGANLLAGFYVMTAKFLGAMEVEPEQKFVGWQLESV